MVVKEFSKDLDRIEKLRKDFVLAFPRDSIMNLTLEQYAMGHGDKGNFCYRLEYEQDGMGKISSDKANVKKYGVWFDKNSKEYLFSKKYGKTVDDAFYKVKSEIVKLLLAGEVEDDILIENCPISELVRYKLLAMYYPHKYLSIYTHLSSFCEKVGIPLFSGDSMLIKQKKLLQWKEANVETHDLTLIEFSDYLYSVFGKPAEKE